MRATCSRLRWLTLAPLFPGLCSSGRSSTATPRCLWMSSAPSRLALSKAIPRSRQRSSSSTVRPATHVFVELADDLLARRGRKVLSWRSFGPSYFQDDVPFAEAGSIRGHAVRALYLLAGATDIYTETGGAHLRGPIFSQWDDMVSAKTYLTGGLGSRHHDEAFGDRFELPPDRAYCERCAAIASIMWNWRLLLLTGEARFADLIERTLYNGFLAGIGFDGTSFFYENPLQVRVPTARHAWYDCACCPPNGMRFLASLEHYFVTTTDQGAQFHQYASCRVQTNSGADGSLDLSVETDYPYAGTVVFRVDAAPAVSREIALRVPILGHPRDCDPERPVSLAPSRAPTAICASGASGLGATSWWSSSRSGLG